MTAFDMTALPDPEVDEALYADVTAKRLFAWVIDVVLISLLTLVMIPFTLFIGLFFLPLMYGVLSFLYRWVTISRGSATLGMRAAAIELRQHDGSPMTPSAAFLHTTGYFVSVTVFPLQLVSVAMMLITERKQGLTDMIMGTAALNRRAI